MTTAVALARENYPVIRAAILDSRAAAARIGEARAAHLPDVDLLAQVNRATINNVTGLLLPQGVIPGISGPPFREIGTSAWNSGAGVIASWQPFDFGARGARVDAAEASARAAEASAQATILDVELGAANAYLNVIAAERLRTTALANVARLDAFARAAQVLVDNKLRPGVEARQADAALGQARIVVAEADRNLAAQRATLAKFVGRSVGTAPLPLPDAPVAIAAPTNFDPASHPLAQAQAARAEGADDQARATRRSFAPEVALVGSASARGAGRRDDGSFAGGDAGLTPNTGNWAVGVQLSMALGAYPAIRARSAAERATAEAERMRYRQTLADLGERRRHAEADVAAARATLEVAPVTLAAARDSEVQQRARFQAGLGTTVEVTAATAALARAEADDAIARVNLWRALVQQAAANGDLSSLLSRAR